MFWPRRRVYLLRRKANVRHNIAFNLCQKIRHDEWHVIYKLGDNIDALIFKKFVEELSEKLHDIEV
jgi:hypothetical protein